MRRDQVEKLLKDVSENSGGPDFRITVPYDEVPAVLTILKHLESSGQFSSYSRRDAQDSCEHCEDGKCSCVMIYDYTG